MSNFYVTSVRKEEDPYGTHRHIAGVFTSTGQYHSRDEVVRSIERGHLWRTTGGGFSATIRVVTKCPRFGCPIRPYLATDPDSTKLDNLENLPEK